MRRAGFIFLILLGLLSACATPPASAQELTVLAAASLTEPFGEIGARFEALHPGVRMQFSFAASSQLAQQIVSGAQADVFASANMQQMTAAAEAGRVAESGSAVFARNRLVVIAPLKNPAGLQSLQDLARPGVKLVLAAAEAPVGQYTLEFLEKASQDGDFGADFQARVIQNVVSYESTVKAVLTKVILGEADAGIVYASDLSQSAAAQVVQFQIPEALNVTAVYPIAVLKDAADPALAAEFAALVRSPEGQQILAKYGFLAGE
ncbi:hypothetical protein ADN01_02815 [Levilinea saccharolytica]|uniref:Molybdate ABC transporter substrate-binding protein n=2 Tax=Levilinea saccharolytica TaxID=229921 RepID=A0A0P6YZK7_9CHLR|nr:hypothetical protein ADN01_02815 [Levilinea saccharolytica]GAP16491.1 molybdenum ABC transporter, periplasmic molybdate-binding protein [Levilinea saccharolytica]